MCLLSTFIFGQTGQRLEHQVSSSWVPSEENAWMMQMEGKHLPFPLFCEPTKCQKTVTGKLEIPQGVRWWVLKWGTLGPGFQKVRVHVFNTLIYRVGGYFHSVQIDNTKQIMHTIYFWGERRLNSGGTLSTKRICSNKAACFTVGDARIWELQIRSILAI